MVKWIFDIERCIDSSILAIHYYTNQSVKYIMLIANEFWFPSFFWTNSLCSWMEIPFLLPVFSFLESASIIFTLFIQSSCYYFDNIIRLYILNLSSFILQKKHLIFWLSVPLPLKCNHLFSKCSIFFIVNNRLRRCLNVNPFLRQLLTNICFFVG